MNVNKEDKDDLNTFRYVSVNHLKRVGKAVMLDTGGESHFLPTSTLEKLVRDEREAGRMAVQTEDGNEETHYVNRDDNGININLNNRVRLHAWEEDLLRLLDEDVAGVNLYRRVESEKIEYKETDIWLNKSQDENTIYFEDPDGDFQAILPEVLESIIFEERKGARFSTPEGEDGFRDTYYVQKSGDSLQIQIGNRSHYVPVEPVKSMLLGERQKGVKMVKRTISAQ